MQSNELLNHKSEKGFTLVELAIVMIIIGLLIGGILKGQELISNAQVTATVAQVKAIEAATTTFRDKYDALPGDMTNVATRIANCNALCLAGAGNGNGRLGNLPSAIPAGEAVSFFPQLAAADLIGGVAADGSAGWGNIYPEAKISGGFQPAYFGGGALGANAAGPAGHYLSLVRDAATAPANNTLTPNEAQRIDTKLDDGVPTAGSVYPANAGGGCQAAGLYVEATATEVCDLYIRFQN